MKKNRLRKFLGGLSFATLLFAFQACYGTPQDDGLDIYLYGKIVSKTNGEPVQGINVFVSNLDYYGTLPCAVSDEDGNFSFFTVLNDHIAVRFEDINPLEYGHFLQKDTVLTNIYTTKILLNIELEEVDALDHKKGGVSAI
ncbi:MAG: carboxypeptidase-like regulatory domain-containing protein [Bacteroidales bacterium]|jgi:hypothetical protein|nr:carboxypeptidase-like regulatory domain-containing protein [Bacteroidales bacterium]